jgi:lysophospholipase L1-like esterase
VASNYPGSLDSFDTIASDKKTSDIVGGRTHRQMHNDLGDAIEAVQGELGINPSGNYSTVAARLDAIDPNEPEMAPWRFSGLHIVPPELCNTRTVYAGDDIVAVRVFQAPDDIVVTGMQMASGAAGGVGVTLAQFALYHVGASASASHNGMSLTLLARSANDTTLFASTDTAYTKSWSTTGGYPSAVRLRRGQWYAAGHVLAWDTTEPQLIGLGAPRLQVQQVPIMGFHAAGMGTFIGEPWPYFSGSSISYGTGAGMLPWRRLVVDPASSIAAAHTTVLLGDSFFASYAGWFAWGNAQSGSKLIPVMNAGVGGERLDQILDRVATHVAPYAPDAVVVHGGTNDVSAGASAATIQSRFTAIFDALDALGVDDIIACTVPSQTGFSAGQKTVVSTVNTWLTGLSRTNLTVADTQMALTTGDGVTSDAAKLVDAVHPNITGQQAMADVLDDVLAAVF